MRTEKKNEREKNADDVILRGVFTASGEKSYGKENNINIGVNFKVMKTNVHKC